MCRRARLAPTGNKSRSDAESLARLLIGELSFQASDASMQPIHGIECPLEPGHPAAKRLPVGGKLLSLPIMPAGLRGIDDWFRCWAQHAPTNLAHACPSLIDWPVDCC